MKISTYTELISNRLDNYFEINNNRKLQKNLELFASSKLVLGRTMVSQKDIIDKFESNEYVLVKHYELLTEDNINSFIDYIKNTVSLLVKPHKEHKSSYINAVIACYGIANELDINKIKKFKCEKIYKFYFHGFSEIRLFVVDISNNLVISNKAGKKLKEVYLPTP